MSPNTIVELVRRDPPLIRRDEPVPAAVERLLRSGLPALPVIDEQERLVGIFGEREFITALFPGYVGTLGSAGFVPKSIDAALAKRLGCRTDPVAKHMNTEHIDVATDVSDVGIAEIFLHHRVLIVPVTENRRVIGVITRSDFFAAVAERFLSAGDAARPEPS